MTSVEAAEPKVWQELGELIAELVFRSIFEALIPQLPAGRGGVGCCIVVLLTLLFVGGVFAVLILVARS